MIRLALANLAVSALVLLPLSSRRVRALVRRLRLATEYNPNRSR